MMIPTSLSAHARLATAWVMVQVTRDKLLREHLYNEKVDISRETGSGYPAGMPSMILCSHQMC